MRFRELGIQQRRRLWFPLFMREHPALHRWTAVAPADLPSEIRNGGGNDPERLPFRKRRGALEGHRRLRAPVWEGCSGTFKQNIYSYSALVQSFYGNNTALLHTEYSQFSKQTNADTHGLPCTHIYR